MAPQSSKNSDPSSNIIQATNNMKTTLKIRNRLVSGLAAIVALGVFTAPIARAQSAEELQQLKANMQQMQKYMEEMKKKIAELEKEMAATAAKSAIERTSPSYQ